MRTLEEKNGVVKEAIVLQWAVRNASCDFKPGKKEPGQSLWTLDWTVDWTLDSIMDLISGLKFRSPRIKVTCMLISSCL